MNPVERYYDDECDREWQRMDRHKLEFALTKRAMEIYLPAGSRILDVGGGPGRYSVHLAGKGHAVTLLDLSAQNVRRALAEAENESVTLEGAIHGNALKLDEYFTPESFDAVLCMGPMYHLPVEADRRLALEQCMRVLKPGGILMLAFISAYAPIVDSLKRYPETIVESAQRYLSYLQDGHNKASDGFTEAFFMHPDAIPGLLEGLPLHKLRLIASEGLGALAEPQINALPEDQFQAWVDLFWSIADHPALFGACEHLLYVAAKE